ncbi:hypothetical protein [Isoptericola croceus]|uniref:hypothetical protein n=1 Tax=Isoptericola croceus TaxID=3031406 RepID=UPI0023F85CFA|nr:hypothetical protein [Isoptericola croceus]
MERSRLVDALADAIGVTTVTIGAGLSVAPDRFGRLLGLSGSARRARGIGLADLALGAAILSSGRAWPRHRWPALVGREALHVAIANEYRRLGAPAGMWAMGGLFVVDRVVTVLMCRAETGLPPFGRLKSVEQHRGSQRLGEQVRRTRRSARPGPGA